MPRRMICTFVYTAPINASLWMPQRHLRAAAVRDLSGQSNRH